MIMRKDVNKTGRTSVLGPGETIAVGSGFGIRFWLRAHPLPQCLCAACNFGLHPQNFACQGQSWWLQKIRKISCWMWLTCCLSCLFLAQIEVGCWKRPTSAGYKLPLQDWNSNMPEAALGPKPQYHHTRRLHLKHNFLLDWRVYVLFAWLEGFSGRKFQFACGIIGL